MVKTSQRAASQPSEILDEMVRIVRAHAGDVGRWASVPLSDFFDLVRRGSYNREPDGWGAQVLARPSLTIHKRAPVVACANKAIILASWAQLHGIPWRLVAVGRIAGRSPHHVFPEMFIGGAWRPVDATYRWSVLFAPRPYPVRIEAVGLEAPR